MIFLNRGYFRPMLIILSLVFLPIIALGVLWLVQAETFMPLIGIAIVAIIYFSLLLIVKKISKSTKYYLMSNPDYIEIKYPNLAKNNNLDFSIPNTDIIQFDYCKLASIKAWLLIPVYDLPQCVFMTYMENGTKVCKLIGYMGYGDVQELAQRIKVKLVVH